jgi:hypothetical protein
MDFATRLKFLVKSVRDPEAARLLREAIAHIEEQDRDRKRRSRRPSEVCASSDCPSRPFEDGECWTCPACTSALKEKIAEIQSGPKPPLSMQPPEGGSKVYFRGELLLLGTLYSWDLEKNRLLPIFHERILRKATMPWTGPPMLRVVYSGEVACEREFDWDGQGWVLASGDRE